VHNRLYVSILQAGASAAALIEGLLGSAEAAQVPDAVFVTGLIRTVLGREPVTGEVGADVSYLQHGGTRAGLGKAFVESPESYGRLVDSYYLAFLHRPADPGPRQTWMNLLGAGTLTLDAVAAGLLGSPEFFGAAQAATP
jgi:hypothetical protein